ncbi:MAG: hypothetical protein Q8R92_04205 [Deltaproteobacteria bacterium]|nr:hypothetical protein [Deltaproteobacteria bacterium]
MTDPLTPERVRSLHDGASPDWVAEPDTGAITSAGVQILTTAAGNRAGNLPLALAAPDLADTLLQAWEQRDAARADADRLRDERDTALRVTEQYRSIVEEIGGMGRSSALVKLQAERDEARIQCDRTREAAAREHERQEGNKAALAAQVAALLWSALDDVTDVVRDHLGDSYPCALEEAQAALSSQVLETYTTTAAIERGKHCPERGEGVER